MAAPIRCLFLRFGQNSRFNQGLFGSLRLCFNTKTKKYFSKSVTTNSVRVRFAPSPTGFLHLGGLRTALYNYLFAKSKKGSFLLRIEDTDQTRLVPGTAEHLQEILEWVGIIPDEGPAQGGDHGPYIQSKRLRLYNDHVKTLLDNGWAYPCFCSTRRLELMRKEAVQKGEPSKYDNRCRHLSLEEIEKLLINKTPFVIRLKLEPTPEPWDDLIQGSVTHDISQIEGDPVLLKSDGCPTYHFANVVDDHLMGITHVLRGSEWLSSTPKHILLYKAFGWSPPVFGHLPLIVNPDGSKLSKRQGDVDVDEMRAVDHFPQSVLNYVTSIGGGFPNNSTKGMSLKDMCQKFDLSLIRKQVSRLDPVRLKEAAIHNLTTRVDSKDPGEVSELIDRLQDHVIEAFLDRLGDGDCRSRVLSHDYMLQVIQWGLKDQRVTVLRDFVRPELSYLWVTPTNSQRQELVTMETSAESILCRCIDWIKNCDENEMGSNMSVDVASVQLKAIGKEMNIPSKRFFHFMRKAMTGDVQGPPVAEMISVLGNANVLQRLESALDAVSTNQS